MRDYSPVFRNPSFAIRRSSLGFSTGHAPVFNGFLAVVDTNNLGQRSDSCMKENNYEI